MALILNIETATPVCSVSLAKDGMNLAHYLIDSSNSHSSFLAQAIKNVMAMGAYQLNDLDAIAVSQGPGSYTGLRIGTSTAKGLCFALDIPLIAIPTLQSMAYALKKTHPKKDLYVTNLDSRKGEIYIAVFDSDLNPVIEAQPIKIDEIDSLDLSLKNAVANNLRNKKLENVKNLQSILSDKPLIVSALNMNMLSFIKFKNKDYKNLIYYEPLYLKPVYVKTGIKKPII